MSRTTLLIKIQRLDANADARTEQQFFTGGIPERDGKVAVNLIDEIKSELFIEVQDGLGVRAGTIFVSALFEALPQLCMVVDLAIENDPNALLGAAAHRLSA